jgi:hypothetical protein
VNLPAILADPLTRGLFTRQSFQSPTAPSEPNWQEFEGINLLPPAPKFLTGSPDVGSSLTIAMRLGSPQ